MSRPRKEETTHDLHETQEEMQPEVRKPNVKPAPKLVGTGEGLVKYDLVRLEVSMATRPTTKPGGIGNEGYPPFVTVLGVHKTVKITEEIAEQQNRGIAGCVMASPGNPNHCLYYIPHGKVNVGMRIKSDAKWIPQYNGMNIVNYNLEMILDI